MVLFAVVVDAVSPRELNVEELPVMAISSPEELLITILLSVPTLAVIPDKPAALIAFCKAAALSAAVAEELDEKRMLVSLI